jgi:hypothetical protein
MIKRRKRGSLATGCDIGAAKVRHDINSDLRRQVRAVADLQRQAIGRCM